MNRIAFAGNIIVDSVKTVALAFAASLAVNCHAGGMPDTDRIELEGDYAGHLQDVWWDGGTNLWWAHTRQVLRTDLAGKVVARADVDGHNAGCGSTRKNTESGRFESALVRCKAPEWGW
jgi:hypothetical protein